ncbi:MAG: hypothetical protein JRN27_02885 [Nitrososphaerota archaeon]|nr:hypothetical protein [Nitrososphaerota archaeon]MDG7009731.1 hypothetical protein [Nitrososphaerota archaeon]MDG7019716.1 hypothetical protein [Nitrososphaerota archaeon]
MKRLASAALLLLLVLAFVPAMGAVHAQGAPSIEVKSVYTLNTYGFAVVNETVIYTNNSTSPLTPPSVEVGIGSLSSLVAACSMYVPQQEACSGPSGGPYAVAYSGSIPPGNSTSVKVSVLLNNVVTNENGTLQVSALTSPSVSTKVASLVNQIQLPQSTYFEATPKGFGETNNPTNTTYSFTETNVPTQAANTTVAYIPKGSEGSFNPLRVFYVNRTVTALPSGDPLITDEIQFENLGIQPLTSLSVSILGPASTQVTILTVKGNEPVLLSPTTEPLSNGAIDLTPFALGYPSNGVQSGANFTLRFQYPLGAAYYSVKGGEVTLSIPEAPPVKAFIGSYSILLSLPQGARQAAAPPGGLGAVTPWQGGEATISYAITAGWFLDGGVPMASVVFILLLIGLFAVRTTASPGEEEEEEEETSSELASGMITAFDEKTNVINGLWPEIDGKDPNEFDRAYFDELRGRLDSLRSKALQRLNETRQKSASQKFSEVVNQIQATEREVDRAAKDKLNLYQQYHLRQMRKEVFDRLLPQYSKRLERALNQLSDELHTVQREAKLL